MFNFLVSNSLKHRLFVLAAALMLAIYGSFLLPRLPVDVLPDLTRPTVTVMADTEGLAPEEVERLVAQRNSGRRDRALHLRHRLCDGGRRVQLGD